MSLFQDKYTVIKKLGQGGYGQVNLVKSKATGEEYADKFFSGDADYNEINILSSFEHPNLLHQKDICLDANDKIHIILPLADSDLSKYISSIPEADKYSRTVELMYQIISAIIALNKFDYFHCDLKPENILMFGDRPVVADYSLTRSGSNKLIIDLACGTPTLKDYQTFGQQFKGDAPRFKSMFGVDIIPYLDERPNYDQNDVFGLGAIMYHIYFKKPLIDYTDFVKEYSNLQKRMQTLVDSATSDEDRNILLCVQKCVQYKLADRFKNASEILTCNMFKDKVMSQPIPAKMIANYIPTKNWCEEMVSNNKGMIRYKQVTKIVNDWIYSVISKSVENKHLLVFTVFTSLFYRLLEKIKTTNEAQLYGSAALYLANFAVTELPIELDDLVYLSSGAVDKDELEELIPELAVDLKGVLRIPTVYDITDNALEIVWWLNKVCTDCTYLEKSPQQCHDEYAQLETSDSKLLNFRIQKDLVKRVLSAQASKTNYWNISYFKSYDEYFGKQPLTSLKVKFDTNGAVADIIRL